MSVKVLEVELLAKNASYNQALGQSARVTQDFGTTAEQAGKRAGDALERAGRLPAPGSKRRATR
jgi:hypothetical protein